ncbi:MAG TPA: methyltransferase domain-containing protein [Solirubrobacteraceae bacterium]|nr:methyltransferase domain-containing protein [Solirubrobacteraceae bacterium]
MRSVLRAIRNAVIYRGDALACPICGRTFGRFKPGPRNRPDALCPNCGAAERHRLLWVFLQREQRLAGRILHVAPEPAISTRLAESPEVAEYVSTDLDPRIADVQADLTDLPFEDEAFDLVICNHVLEHIPDDRRAMREIRRVLRPSGAAVMQHPIDARRDATFEDPQITEPAEREAAYFQSDHVRIYGRDFADRLREAGFDVTVRRYRDELSPDLVQRHALTQAPSERPERDIEADVIYVCR